MSAMQTPAEWTGFLQQHAAAAGAPEWPGHPGAAEAQLLAAESRLKIRLPPSYRAFLSASNGWQRASRAVPVLRSAEKIRWFRREHREWVQAYLDPMQGVNPRLPAEQDYFNYSLENSVDFDPKHLPHTLCVSEVGDSAVLLLNPMAVWPDGEWETWFFANWLPGAARYLSFADWMRSELAELRDEPFAPACHPGELPTVYLDGPFKAIRRVRPREKPLVLAKVLAKLASEKGKDRIKAAQQLCRLGGQESLDALLKTLKDDSDPDVRCEAAEALGKLAAPEAVPALMAAIDDPGVNTTAIHALAGFKDEASAQCLLRILADGGMHATSAVHPLVVRGDARAVEHLNRFLLSPDPRDQHIGNIAGRLMAEFQEPGFLALEPLMNHPQTEVRSRAITGMSDLASLAREKSLKLRAREVLQRCLATETDAQLRQWLAVSVEMFAKKKSPAADNPFA